MSLLEEKEPVKRVQKYLNEYNLNLKVISFYAKKARGMMVRFIVKNKCKNLQEILSFNLGGYSYSEEHTIDSNSPVFIR